MKWIIIIYRILLKIFPIRRKLEMAKKKQEEIVVELENGSEVHFKAEDVKEDAIKSEEIVFDEFALGVAKDHKTGLWHLIEIPYNLEKNAVGKITTREQGDMRAIINERFVITAAQLLDVST
jgi:hypothetical protein